MKRANAVRSAKCGVAILLACGALPAAYATLLSGSIVDPDERPIAGAIVTVTDSRGVADSVYSDAKGRFRLETSLQGKLDFWVRKRYHRDERRDLDASVATDGALKVSLQPLTDPQAISDDHPFLSRFSRIDFDRDEKALFSRPNFARDCLSCHTLGDPQTRKRKSVDEWASIVQRMHGYLGNGDPKAIRDRAERLAKTFDDSAVSSKPIVPVDPMIFTAKLHRWRLDGALAPHDPAVHSGDNRIYTVDMMAGKVLETDLVSGRTVEYVEPADGMPPGGVFTKMGMPAPYGMTVPRAPHSLAESTDGRFYMTDLVGNAIGVFDPRTKRFEHYDVGAGALYPHTIRADKAGVLWFTVAFSNHVGRFDPKTKDMRLLKLPDTPSLSIVGGPSPYGIDVDPRDGGVWYAKLASDRIGRIDSKTLEIREFDSPVRGPRRIRFDPEGRLWVAGFSEGAIARIDVHSWKAKVYRLPVFAPGEIPAPYALAIHPKTHDVWVNDTMLDVAWRFLPKEERFVAYPLPLKGTYTRDFTFPKQGWACTTNNNVPGFVEGGAQELICIDPGKG
ncbi:MAG: carboxypeptidase regulatory-like domain-containing protein [Burkholderiaceae bacterium]|jgi:streptogramin lyase|nr:carboxypeptidase regulatory-like domain-containing protein [Burkholderiaceae bacterium]